MTAVDQRGPIEVVAVRYPDGPSAFEVFVSGRAAEVEVFDVDAGAGWTWADWREHRDGLLARAKHPSTRRRLLQTLADPPGGEYVTGRTVPWLDCAPGTYWLHMGAEGALPADTVSVASEADDPVLMSFVDDGSWEVWAEPDSSEDTAHLVSVFDHAPSIQEVRQERQRWATRFGRPLFDLMVLTGPDWSVVEAEWMPCALEWGAAEESPTDPVASIWEDVDQWRQRKVVMSSCARVTSPSEAGDSAQASRVAAPEHQTVLLVGYEVDRACVAAARHRLQQAGSHVRDALRVTDGQVWTWEGDAPEPVAAGEGCQAVAELIGAGSAPVDSRATVYARVLPRERAARLDLAAAVPANLAATWMLWQTVVDRGVEGLADEALATAVASLQDDDVARALLLAIGGPRLKSLISTGTPADVHPAASPGIVLDRFCGLCRAIPDDPRGGPHPRHGRLLRVVPGRGRRDHQRHPDRAEAAGIESPMLDVLDVAITLGLR